MGHALVAASNPLCHPVHKISIIPRGIGALGYTIQRPTEDRFLMTREELEAKLAVLMGGRGAEHVVFGHFSTGASDDLARATNIARSMATRYAMVPALGSVSYEQDQGPGFLGMAQTRRDYSEQTARELDEAVRRIVDQAFDRARSVLTAHRDVLEEGARALLARETLDEKDLSALFARVRGAAVPSPAATSAAA